MTDHNRIDRLLERFANRPDQTGERTDASGPVPYVAAELVDANSVAASITLGYANGDLEMMRYSAVASIYYEAATGSIALITRSGSLMLIGTHLRTLFDDLQRQRVKLVRAFNPHRHQPVDGATMVISQLGWRSVKTSQDRLANG
jgi:hypothetical protein